MPFGISNAAQAIEPAHLTALLPSPIVTRTRWFGLSTVKCAGAIAWAAFEMPKGMPTRYRAGIDWGMTPEGPGVDAFSKKNKKDEK